MHWRVKNADNTLKGFHLDLQGMMGTKMPVALLNFVFKHTMLRKGMKKVKAAGFNGYTPEEIETFGVKNIPGHGNFTLKFKLVDAGET